MNLPLGVGSRDFNLSAYIINHLKFYEKRVSYPVPLPLAADAAAAAPGITSLSLNDSSLSEILITILQCHFNKSN